MNDEYQRLKRLQQAVQVLAHADLNRFSHCADIHRRERVIEQHELEMAWASLGNALDAAFPWFRKLANFLNDVARKLGL